MEIGTIITLSTIHLKETTTNLLQNPNNIPLPVYPTPYGCFLFINNIDAATEEYLEANWSDLLTCITFAARHNGNWIQFDRDAKPHAELPIYTWKGTGTTQRHRISKKEYYLNIAMSVSKRSTCLRRHYGAVIVNNDEIIATGYNGSARGEKNCCDIHDICPRHDKAHNSGDYSDCSSVHAEQNALLSAARNELNNATLYLNGEEYNKNGFLIPIKEIEPCPICLRMIKNAGIQQIITPSKVITLKFAM